MCCTWFSMTKSIESLLQHVFIINACSASSWSTTTVDYSNDVGSPNSIGVDSNNGIHVSYFQNNPNYDFKYAKCLSSCSSQSSWSTTTLFSSGLVGWQNSIAVNQNDDSIHFTFTNWTDASFLTSLQILLDILLLQNFQTD